MVVGGQAASLFAQFVTMAVCVTLNQASAYVHQALMDHIVILVSTTYLGPIAWGSASLNSALTISFLCQIFNQICNQIMPSNEEFTHAQAKTPC